MSTKNEYPTKQLMVRLGPDDMASRGKQLAAMLEQIAIGESRKKSLTSELKKLEEKVEEIRAVILNGQELREIKCRCFWNYDAGITVIRRVDTGEEVERRIMTNDERQQDLPLETEEVVVLQMESPEREPDAPEADAIPDTVATPFDDWGDDDGAGGEAVNVTPEPETTPEPEETAEKPPETPETPPEDDSNTPQEPQEGAQEPSEVVTPPSDTPKTPKRRQRAKKAPKGTDAEKPAEDAKVEPAAIAEVAGWSLDTGDDPDVAEAHFFPAGSGDCACKKAKLADGGAVLDEAFFLEDQLCQECWEIAHNES